MFQCRTRLCGWCSQRLTLSLKSFLVRFNAARGFVGGAACSAIEYYCRRSVSMPHAALWVVQLCRTLRIYHHPVSFNAARGFVGGAAPKIQLIISTSCRFQCRTRLCGWCSFRAPARGATPYSFNAARGFVGGAAHRASMSLRRDCCFNAARGFVGGAAPKSCASTCSVTSFNAARGFVGGAAL